MQFDMNRFRDTFFDEAAEHLANMEAGLLGLEQASDSRELLNDIFRCAHSIKGASATFGFAEMARFTHGLESLLDRMREGALAPSPSLVAMLLRGTDVLKGLVVSAKDGGPAPAEVDAMLEELAGFLQAGDAPAPPSAPGRPPTEPGAGAARTFAISFVPCEDLFRQGMDPMLLLRDLAQLGDLTDLRMDASRLPAVEHLDPESCYLSWSLSLRTTRDETAVRDVFAFVEDTCRVDVQLQSDPRAHALAADGSPAVDTDRSRGEQARADRRSGVDRRADVRALEASSIRVPTEKVDKLVDLVGEVVISQSMLVQNLEQFSFEKLPLILAAAAEMQRNTRELQERVMAIRMVPVGNIFGRFPRLVHDLAASLGKSVSLDISGADTELDKGVVEQIADPLTHLIRNAVDHGLESTDERIAAGKPSEGLVRVHACHRAGNVIVEVSDDGRGLNTARIREKALAHGLVRPDEVLTEEQTQALIFRPGFSTASVVSDISGRGVGLDVVKRNVEALNGAVGIESVPGRGTTFRVKLPLTLAILDGLQLALGDDVFVMPLLSIVESFRPAAGDVRTVFGRGEVVMVRGDAVPLLRLHRLLGLTPRHTDPTEALVVLLDHDGRRYGLLVDELLGQSQVVIKSLETNYRKVDGVTGATILGDGRVAFILNVEGLLRLASIDQRAA